MKNFRILSLGLMFVLCGSHRAQFARSLSLSFEANRGQAPPDAQFLARGHGYNVLLTAEGNQLLLRHKGRALSVKTRLIEANPRTVLQGEEKQLAKVHYFRRGMSLRDVPTYARVRSERVYPGIDLVYYGNEQQLEYDFVVSPGADPKRIALEFDGADQLTIDNDGN